MRVFARSLHIYRDAEKKYDYWFPAGQWIEVPGEIATMLVEAHPAKLFILKPGQNTPEDPVERPAQVIVDTEMPPQFDREMKSRRRK